MSSVKITVENSSLDIDLQPFDDLPKIRDKVFLLYNVRLDGYALYYEGSDGVAVAIPETVPMSSLGIANRSVIVARRKDAATTIETKHTMSGDAATSHGQHVAAKSPVSRHRHSVPNLHDTHVATGFQGAQSPSRATPATPVRHLAMHLSVPGTNDVSDPFGRLEETLVMSSPRVASSANTPAATTATPTSPFPDPDRPPVHRARTTPNAAGGSGVYSPHQNHHQLHQQQPYQPSSPHPSAPHRARVDGLPTSPPSLARLASSPIGAAAQNPFAALEAAQAASPRPAARSRLAHSSASFSGTGSALSPHGYAYAHTHVNASHTPSAPSTPAAHSHRGSMVGSPTIAAFGSAASSAASGTNNPFDAFSTSGSGPVLNVFDNLDRVRQTSDSSSRTRRESPSAASNLFIHTGALFNSHERDATPRSGHTVHSSIAASAGGSPYPVAPSSHRGSVSVASPNPLAVAAIEATAGSNVPTPTSALSRRPSSSSSLPLASPPSHSAHPDVGLSPHLLLLLETAEAESRQLIADRDEEAQLKSYAVDALQQRARAIQSARLKAEAAHAADLARLEDRVRAARDQVREEERKSAAYALECECALAAGEKRLTDTESHATSFALDRLARREQLDEWTSDLRRRLGAASLTKEEHSEEARTERRQALERMCDAIESKDELARDLTDLLVRRRAAREGSSSATNQPAAASTAAPRTSSPSLTPYRSRRRMSTPNIGSGIWKTELDRMHAEGRFKSTATSANDNHQTNHANNGTQQATQTTTNNA